MVSRYICEIHDEIDEAIKRLRIDLIPGLCEEARTCGKRMEAKLMEYQSMKYDVRKYKELKKNVARLKATEEFLLANLDLEEVENEEDDSWPDD